MKPLGLGIIGLRHQHPRWYQPLWRHLPQYKPLAVAEADAKFLKTENESFRLDAYADYRDLLGRDDIDVVIIWLPHSEMPQAVEDAAAAGKHVIVEKPCASDVEGAMRIVAAARRNPEIRIAAPYCWRTHPVSEKLRRMVQGGLLGEITAVQARLNAGGAGRYIRDSSPWMLRSCEGGGPMWNLGVHWVDYFRWIMKSEIVGVSGATSGPRGEPPRDIEDNAQAVLRFDNGAVGILDVSYSLPASYPGVRDIHVALRGTLGAVSWTPAWQGITDELVVAGGHEGVDGGRCERIKVTSKDIPGYCGHMAWAWLRDFAASIRQGRDSAANADDILAAVRVADAFYQSARSGRVETVT